MPLVAPECAPGTHFATLPLVFAAFAHRDLVEKCATLQSGLQRSYHAFQYMIMLIQTLQWVVFRYSLTFPSPHSAPKEP